MAISIFGNDNIEVPQFVRIGTVSSVNRNNCTVKVFFEDRDETVSHDLRVIVKNTMKKKHYWLPDVGETVLCLFLPNGEETGFVIGSPYSEVDRPVSEIYDEGKERIGFWVDESNFIKWDGENRKFIIRTENPVEFEVVGG